MEKEEKAFIFYLVIAFIVIVGIGIITLTLKKDSLVKENVITGVVSTDSTAVRIIPNQVLSVDKVFFLSQENPNRIAGYAIVTRFVYQGVHFIQFGTGKRKSVMLDPFVYGTPSESSTSQINRQIDSYNNDYKSLFGD